MRKEIGLNHKRLSIEEIYATYTFNLIPPQKYIILFKNAKTLKVSTPPSRSFSFPPVPSLLREFHSRLPPPSPPVPLILREFHSRPHLFLSSLPNVPSQEIHSRPPPSPKNHYLCSVNSREFYSRPKFNNNGKRNLHLATTRCMAQTMHSTRNNDRQREAPHL